LQKTDHSENHLSVFGTTEHIAEFGLKQREILERYPTGAQTQHLLSIICEPAEIVPLL
jgi:hypothetical protein